MGGSVYDYGRRDSYKTEHDGGTDIKYGRFLDELWLGVLSGRTPPSGHDSFWHLHYKSFGSLMIRVMKPKNLYPIPNKVLLTNSNLKQNPGYSK